MIDIKKKYRCKASENVRIVFADDRHAFGYVDDKASMWDCDGRFIHTFRVSDLDLIEVNPYEGIAIDAPVWVRGEWEDVWFPRHFAGIDKLGFPKAWEDGKTSHTADGKSFAWPELTTTKPEGGE